MLLHIGLFMYCLHGLSYATEQGWVSENSEAMRVETKIQDHDSQRQQATEVKTMPEVVFP